MSEYSSPYLCGGTFFNLLLEAKTNSTYIRSSLTNEYEKNTEVSLLKRLVSIFNDDLPSYKEDTLKKNTSDFKRCTLKSSGWLNFDNKALLNAYNSKYQNDYISLLKKMHLICCDYEITTNKGWIVKALLKLISLDNKISETDIFNLGLSKKEVTKKEILLMDSFILEEFLLGVWNYIITIRPETNSIAGEQTFYMWYDEDIDSQKYRKPKFISDIGNNYNNITVETYMDITSTDSDTSIKDNNSLSDKVLLNNSFDFDSYKDNTIERFKYVHTLIFRDKLLDIDDIYVCNNIRSTEYIHVNYQDDNESIYQKNITSSSIFNNGDLLIIEGAGGLGKSMMLRHLFLDALENYESTLLLPVFLNLRDFNEEHNDFLGFLIDATKEFLSDSDYNSEILLHFYNSGKLMILMDGLDEMSESNRVLFFKTFHSYIKKQSNKFIISSRPINNFNLISNFKIIYLEPLDKQQSISLIKKLDFRPDAPEIKKRFLDALENTLYDTHKEFVENPLLLTIMLLTYEEFAEIPSKIHNFYSAAFHTLVRHHDATKGAFLRPLKSGLSIDSFEEFMEQFCTLSYKDEAYSPSYDQINRYVSRINDKQHTKYETSDIIYDLTTNTSLMYYDDNKYSFIHRSFQEYFCALYFSKRKDKSYKHIADFFESSSYSTKDKTLAMLYDMVPGKVEEFIFLPCLKKVFDKIDSVQEPILEYLYSLYNSVFLSISNSRVSMNRFSTSSYIYSFIINHLHLNYSFIIDVTDIIKEMNPNKINNPQLKNLLLKPIKRTGSIFSPITIDMLINESELSKIKEIVASERFGIIQEYKAVREFYESLQHKYNNSLAVDWFDEI